MKMFENVNIENGVCRLDDINCINDVKSSSLLKKFVKTLKGLETDSIIYIEGGCKVDVDVLLNELQNNFFDDGVEYLEGYNTITEFLNIPVLTKLFQNIKVCGVKNIIVS